MENLKRLQGSANIIKLLMTFRYLGEYYLIFPWADGDLYKLCTTEILDMSGSQSMHENAVWFSKQCLGIAEGLMTIHNPGSDSSDAHASSSNVFGAPNANEIHGRHGDLKPRNILWFKGRNSDGFDAKCHFEICDLGITEFHRYCTLEVNCANLAMTRTYRAPEFDAWRRVTPSFDIWSLGCILLEFIGWYILGTEEIVEFSQRRLADHVPNSGVFPEDSFFTMTEEGARMKRSVDQVSGDIHWGFRRSVSLGSC